MERVKKLSAIFLLLAVLSGACACGNKGKTPEPTVSAAPPAVKIDFALAKDNVTALTVALDDTAAPSSPPAGTEYADVADDGSPIDGPADGSVPLMGNLEPMGADRLAASYGVDTSCFDEFDFEFAFASIKSNMYLIVKPKPGAKAGAQAELDLFSRSTPSSGAPSRTRRPGLLTATCKKP